MCHCGAIQEITLSGLSAITNLTWNPRGKVSSMEAVDREPMEPSNVGTNRVILVFTGITRIVTPLGTLLEMVLGGVAPVEQFNMT